MEEVKENVTNITDEQAEKVSGGITPKIKKRIHKKCPNCFGTNTYVIRVRHEGTKEIAVYHCIDCDRNF